jgi:transposase
VLMKKATEIVMAQELFGQGLSKPAIARRLGRDRETIRLWLRGVEAHGQKVFLDKSAAACKVSRPSRQVDAQGKRMRIKGQLRY